MRKCKKLKNEQLLSVQDCTRIVMREHASGMRFESRNSSFLATNQASPLHVLTCPSTSKRETWIGYQAAKKKETYHTSYHTVYNKKKVYERVQHNMLLSWVGYFMD